MDTFEIGDVIALKSGSLPITIISIDSDNIIEGIFANLQGDLVKISLPAQSVDYTEKRWSIMDIDADIDDEDNEF